MGYFTEANGALMEVSGFCITCASTRCDHYHSFPLRVGLVLFLLARLFENQECRVEKRPFSETEEVFLRFCFLACFPLMPEMNTERDFKGNDHEFYRGQHLLSRKW